MDAIATAYSYCTLAAHGTVVGFSDDFRGNSEVGYAAHFSFFIFASFSIVVSWSIKKRKFHKATDIILSFERASEQGSRRLHLPTLSPTTYTLTSTTSMLSETTKEPGVL
ncbi:hypothetical protein BD779DRAFT_1678713 [Infundibulicybe gibba]|nr:hypothetical protein BD779DRAFT_1678713 [Infundibulicybe gibba]